MLHQFLTWLGFEFHHTLDTITSPLKKIVSDLEAYKDRHTSAIISKAETQAKLDVEISAHSAEVTKAVNAAAKIGGLLA